jgi:undecaprenyl-diphosphatase
VAYFPETILGSCNPFSVSYERITLSIWQAFWLALLQGTTEILPVSSLGHSVLLPALLGWDVDQKSPTFLPFFVVLHLGTAAALLLFFRQEWVRVLRGFFGSLRNRTFRGDEDGKLAWLLIIGTVPAGLVGLVFERGLAANFARPVVAAIFLILNGVVLLVGERLRRWRTKPEESKLRFWQAMVVGTSQVLALIPGISRSGVTVVGGLASGLSAEVAARFSFLLATPIILAAGVLEVPKLLEFGTPRTLGIAVFGGVVAGIGAYLSTMLLMLLFRKREIEALGPFGYYCIGVGIVGLLLLSLVT